MYLLVRKFRNILEPKFYFPHLETDDSYPLETDESLLVEKLKGKFTTSNILAINPHHPNSIFTDLQGPFFAVNVNFN